MTWRSVSFLSIAAPLTINVTTVAAAAVLDNVFVDTQSFVGGFVISNSAMVVMSHCTMTYHGSIIVNRSKIMVDDSALRSEHYSLFDPLWGTGGRSAITASESTIVVSRSTIAGASANRDGVYAGNAWPAIKMCKSNITIGKGCRIEGGAGYYGGFYYATSFDCSAFQPPPPQDCSMAMDPGTVLFGPLINDTAIHYDFSPQTGLSYQVSPMTLTVTHLTNPQSLCILGIGALTTQPWTNIVGPVFVQPNTAVQYWDLAPMTGPLVRTFAIPPGLPSGYQVALQAFELLQSGAVRTSNAGIVAVP